MSKAYKRPPNLNGDFQMSSVEIFALNFDKKIKTWNIDD